jgi:pyruvate ferredoxin oxidoreductase delta subunit
VLTTHCTACALCALFCPEGAITRVDGTMVVDYLHCKGCGICEVVCPIRDAVEMEEVPA